MVIQDTLRLNITKIHKCLLANLVSQKKFDILFKIFFEIRICGFFVMNEHRFSLND